MNPGTASKGHADVAGCSRKASPHPSLLSLRSRCPVMRYPVGTLRQLGWAIGKRTTVINWCGHENGYVPRAETVDGWFKLVPVLL